MTTMPVTRWRDHILGPDTTDNRPAPTDAPPAALYQNTDTGDLEVNTGSAWVTYRSAVAAGVASVVAGTGISVDDTDPANPVVSATGGGGGGSGEQHATPIQDIASSNVASSTKSATLPSTPTTGNIIVLAANNATSNNISSVSQTGVTWTKVKGTSGLSCTPEIWVGVVGSSPGTTITVTYSTSVAGCWWAGEFSGFTGTLDQFNVSSATMSSSAGEANGSGAITPASGALVVAALGTDFGSVHWARLGLSGRDGIGISPPALFGNPSTSDNLMNGCMPGVWIGCGEPTYAQWFGGASGNHASVIVSLT